MSQRERIRRRDKPRYRNAEHRRAVETPGAHWSDCKGKCRYRDDEQAKRAADRARRVRGHAVRWYHCHICNGYHLTRQEPR